MCVQHVDIWSRNLGNESSGVSEAVSQRNENAEDGLQSDKIVQ